MYSLMAQQNMEVSILCDPDMNVLRKRHNEFNEKFNIDPLLEQDQLRVYINENPVPDDALFGDEAVIEYLSRVLKSSNLESGNKIEKQ